MMIRRLLAGAALLTLGSAVPAAAPADQLRIVFIDVEGGAATLYITPQGHSLLIDTGWVAGAGGPRPAPGAPPAPPPMPSSAVRIANAVKAAGLNRIDYLLISHYHPDHIGGAPELMSLLPVGTVINHGPSREPPRPPQIGPDGKPIPSPLEKLQAAMAGHKQIVMNAGQTMRIDQLTLTAVDSDGQVINRPLAKATAVPDCGSLTSRSDTGGEENVRSLGLIMNWGKARVLALADTTWDVENRIACPRNLVGPVDLMQIDNHGTENSNSPALLQSVRPRVIVFNNGPVKGADPQTFDRVAQITSRPAVWQVHYATRSPEKNAPAEQIANLDGPDAVNSLLVAVGKDRSIAVTNPRTGKTQTYR